MNEPTPPASDIPPIIAWASRNSGIIFFLLLFSVAMIEGVAIYASKRKAAAESGAVPTDSGAVPTEASPVPTEAGAPPAATTPR